MCVTNRKIGAATARDLSIARQSASQPADDHKIGELLCLKWFLFHFVQSEEKKNTHEKKTTTQTNAQHSSRIREINSSGEMWNEHDHLWSACVCTQGKRRWKNQMKINKYEKKRRNNNNFNGPEQNGKSSGLEAHVRCIFVFDSACTLNMHTLRMRNSHLLAVCFHNDASIRLNWIVDGGAANFTFSQIKFGRLVRLQTPGKMERSWNGHLAVCQSRSHTFLRLMSFSIRFQSRVTEAGEKPVGSVDCVSKPNSWISNSTTFYRWF